MKKLYIGFYAFFFILFGLLGYLAHQFHNFPGDTAISLWLQGIDLPFFALLMRAVSYPGSTVPSLITVLLVAAVLWYYRRRLEVIFVISLPVVATLLNWLLKLAVDRPRPGSELINSGGVSFPSGHVTYAIVFCGLLFYLAPRLVRQPAIVRVLQLLLVLFILLTGASRVYLGAHWPSDVLGSLLLGGLLLVPTVVLYNNCIKGNKRDYLLTSPP